MSSMDPRAQLRAYWREVHAKRAARKKVREETKMMMEKKAREASDESKEDEKQAKGIAVKSK
jgi:hypothetical protein